MFLPAAVVTSLLAFLQGTAATASDATNNQRYSDELIAAMVKTAKEHQLTSATAAATAVNGLRPSMINQILAKDPPVDLPPTGGDDAKPKPVPKEPPLDPPTTGPTTVDAPGDVGKTKPDPKPKPTVTTAVMTETPKLRTAPQSPLSFGLRPSSIEKILGKDKPIPKDPPTPSPSEVSKPKPDPKPKPTPSPSELNYMVFTHHNDDSTCDDSTIMESHGYLTDHCFVGMGDGLTGLFWSFTVAPSDDLTSLILNYNFYIDSLCSTTPLVTSFETVPNGCASRGNSGGVNRFKNFYTSSRPPTSKLTDGVLFNGYATEVSCQEHEGRGKGKDKEMDVINWSFLLNEQCDPSPFSPIYGKHLTDEIRSCTKGKKKGKGGSKGGEMTASLLNSNDMTCSGEVTTVTNLNTMEWNCKYGSNTGVDGVYQEVKCL